MHSKGDLSTCTPSKANLLACLLENLLICEPLQKSTSSLSSLQGGSYVAALDILQQQFLVLFLNEACERNS